ncbi:MAG: tRNA uridine-5-carboxymethylaminomethyl(34) synthesis GTPase MnmE [Deltaproteobacteria bacterium]|nr:tRNA uridine-5-carboxymethylaminomethyl(34) synthesis GTPase MnmE [Deltaproteobacteria bacterium]
MLEASTIAALATAPAPAGIAIIRVSGPKTRTALKALFKGSIDPTLDPRHLVFGEIYDHETGNVIDKALAVFMPNPHSYTGEDVAEFQFHGSPVLVQSILRSLFAFGVSPAEPGEFTKRAFLNGKIDLVQAESVCDLINATSDQALKLAGEHLKGRFSAAVNQIGEPLRNVLAEIEATIDFPDEDIQPQKIDQIAQTLSNARGQVSALLKTYNYGHVVREGFRVLLCGRPNVGKSSLLNLLLGKERAIVTEISGTTRDLIEEEAILGGYRFIFCDSAGITETSDAVEQKGIELARSRIPWADLVLFVCDAADDPKSWQATISELQGKAKKIWMVTNKIDLNPKAFTTHFCDSSICAQNFYLSAKTHDGLEALTEALLEEVKMSGTDRAQASHIVTNERHRACLLSAEDALGRAIDATKRRMPLEIASAEVRIALHSLEEIVGKTVTEDILGRIFSRFCIGK